MIILSTVGVMLGFAVLLAVVSDLRDRKSRLGRVLGSRVDEKKADALIPPPFGHSVSEYLPPPDDGRPRH